MLLRSLCHGKRAMLNVKGPYAFSRRNAYVHPTAADGFSHNKAETYNQVRPTYPQMTVKYMKSLIHTSRQASIAKTMPPSKGDSLRTAVLELGAGTGIFTKAFFSDVSPLNSSFDYTASEPSAGFRSVLEREKPAGVNRVMDATGSSIDLPDKSLDAVVVAQAFHWMANEETIKEVHRVLRPGGVLVLVWNSFDTTVPFINSLESLLDDFYTESVPRYITGDWENVFATPAAKQRFAPINKWTNPTRAASQVTAQFIVDRIHSTSVVATASSEGKREAESRILHLLKSHPDTKNIRDGEYQLLYRSDVAYCIAK